MDKPSFIETKLNGFFRQDFVAKDRVLIKIGSSAAGVLTPGTTPPTPIHNARDGGLEVFRVFRASNWVPFLFAYGTQ